MSRFREPSIEVRQGEPLTVLEPVHLVKQRSYFLLHLLTSRLLLPPPVIPVVGPVLVLVVSVVLLLVPAAAPTAVASTTVPAAATSVTVHAKWLVGLLQRTAPLTLIQ